MGDATVKSNSEKAPKKSFIQGLKSEFKKIIFPDQETLTKQTIAVLVCSIALGIIIAIMDFIMKYGINLIIVK